MMDRMTWSQGEGIVPCLERDDPPTLIDVDELADDLESLRMIAEQAQLDAADALIRECPIRAWEAVQRLAKAAISFSEDWS